MTKILPHATAPGTDRNAVVVRFGNGARLRYAETGPAVEGVSEAWFAPEDPEDDPSRSWDREAESVAAALGAVGAYLTFDSRRRAEFVWGEANLAVLL